MSPTTLERWADALLDALYTADPGATLVRICEDGSGEHELGLLAIDGHPGEALAAIDVPASCSALGLATGGWAAPMGGGRPSAHPDALRVFQVVLVDRGGRVASRLRYPDGSVITEPPAGGAVLAALRSALRRAAAA